MVNFLTNLTALASAVTNIRILDADTGSHAIDLANHACNQLQPVQMFAASGQQPWNLIPISPATSQFQIQSGNCSGFSLSYPGNATGAEALRAQTVIQQNSAVTFTIAAVDPTQPIGPFNIIYHHVLDGDLYLTGWLPNTTYSSTGPLTFELHNAGDVRQQFRFALD